MKGYHTRAFEILNYHTRAFEILNFSPYSFLLTVALESPGFCAEDIVVILLFCSFICCLRLQLFHGLKILEILKSYQSPEQPTIPQPLLVLQGLGKL